jgi:hypothetical protein
MSIFTLETSPKTSISVPSLPHMHADQIDYLKGKLTGSRCFLEYGAGGSTRLAAQIGVERVYSVESDVKYSKEVVKAALADRPGFKLTMKTPNIGVTGAWGRPLNSEKFRRWPGYALDIWDDMTNAGHSPDLVLIDGRFRIACFAASMIHCNVGVEILFDDYIGREKKYRIASALCKPTRVVGKMAVFHVPPDRSFQKLSAALARFSCVF